MANTLPAPATECCPPACDEATTIQIPGPIGPDGEDGVDGTDGVNPFTTFTAIFTIPAELATGVATVADTSWMVIGQRVYGSRVDGSIHAFFEVVAIGGPTSVTLRNLEDAATFMYLENSAPATTLTIGSLLIPAGIQGPSGTLTGAIPAGSQLKGNYNGAGPQLEIPNAKGASVWGNGTDAVEVPAGTNGHMLAYDSTDSEGIKSFAALPLTGGTNVSKSRIARLSATTGLPIPLESTKAQINDPGSAVAGEFGALVLDASSGNTRGTDAVDLQVNRPGAGVTGVASGTQSFIGGGQNNTAATTGSVVVGGDGNSVGTNNRGAIVGGLNNSTTGLEAFIGGGNSNVASSDQATIAGGDNNTASGSESFIGGGADNSAIGANAAVGGGDTNIANGARSFVGGGSNNQANGTDSTIAGGTNNNTSSDASIGGGRDNTASGQYSFIPGGFSGSTSLFGSFTHASSLFSTAGDAQISEILMAVTTANATPTELVLGASNGCPIAAGKSYFFDIKLIAKRTDTLADAIFTSTGVIRNIAGTTTADAISTTEVFDGATLPGTPVTVAADDANDTLDITVTGIAATTIHWLAVVRLLEIG